MDVYLTIVQPSAFWQGLLGNHKAFDPEVRICAIWIYLLFLYLFNNCMLNMGTLSALIFASWGSTCVLDAFVRPSSL